MIQRTIQRNPVAVVSAARTPLAKAFTELADVGAVELGVHAVRAAIAAAANRRPDFAADQVDQLVIGNVAGPADAANIARVIALRAGLPKDRIAHTVNRNCASGMQSLISAWDQIQLGNASVVVAGGTESMSQIPLLFNRRAAGRWMELSRSKSLMQTLRAVSAFRPSDFKPVIGVQLGLTDPVSGLNMGETAELLAREFDLSRDEQDRYALESHRRAAAARERCFLSGEIAEMVVNEESGVSRDNGPRDHQSLEQLARLRPIFDASGTVTAGNSCPLTDGAAALVMAGTEAAKTFADPLGFITDYEIVGCDPHRMGLGPVFAVARLLARTGYSMRDFDLIELNEAFAAQTLACLRAAESTTFARRELGRERPLGEFDRDKLNVHGGAIALGHPVGTTGTRLVLTLLRSLRERGLKRGLATLCVGGGQGVAMIVQTSLEE